MQFYDSKAVLRFFRYPTNTKTRKALEEFLNEIDRQDAERLAKQDDASGDSDPIHVGNFFDSHSGQEDAADSGDLDSSDPNYATRTVI